MRLRQPSWQAWRWPASLSVPSRKLHVRFVVRVEVLVRIVLEVELASPTAEVIRFAVVLELEVGGGVDLHAANRVLHVGHDAPSTDFGLSQSAWEHRIARHECMLKRSAMGTVILERECSTRPEWPHRPA